MKNITKSDIDKALFNAVAKTYYAEIIKKTPGRGIVADAWNIMNRGSDIVIYNKEFGNIVLFLEEGVSEHVIEAKNAKALRFKIQPGNKVVFAKKVNHPGYEARKFIYNILTNKSIENMFENAFENEIKKFF